MKKWLKTLLRLGVGVVLAGCFTWLFTFIVMCIDLATKGR